MPRDPHRCRVLEFLVCVPTALYCILSLPPRSCRHHVLAYPVVPRVTSPASFPRVFDPISPKPIHNNIRGRHRPHSRCRYVLILHLRAVKTLHPITCHFEPSHHISMLLRSGAGLVLQKARPKRRWSQSGKKPRSSSMSFMPRAGILCELFESNGNDGFYVNIILS